MTHLLAFDPGATSGWAMWTTDGDIFRSGQLPFLEAIDYAEQWIYENYKLGFPGAVIAERFIIDQRTVATARGDTNWSIETIGTLRWLCHRYEHSFGLLSASDTKNFANDQLLKALGWYKPGQDHANDAARVLAVGLYQTEPRLWKTLVLSSALLTEDRDDSEARDRF